MASDNNDNVIGVAITGKMVDSVFMQKSRPKAETIEWKMSGFYSIDDRKIPATIIFRQKERQLTDGSFCKGNRLELLLSAKPHIESF